MHQFNQAVPASCDQSRHSSSAGPAKYYNFIGQMKQTQGRIYLWSHFHHVVRICVVIFLFFLNRTELLRRIKRYQVANHSCIVIKYEKDNRYDAGGVATHDRQTLRASSCSVLEDIKEKAQDYSVIGIDEGQFFPDIVQFAEEMAGLGKVIIVAALDGTFQREAFGPILKLVPLAESVVKLSAVCMHCYRDAAFTKRLGAEKKVEVIGGADKYMAVCRECYHFSHVHGVLAGAPIKYNYH
ncbi:PREDICTED: thymidine kinase, cytosolic-like [Acropora digitifera]|uniref:thymidine kinase, cytosolic-like n=1 Tax=Acropora digitifera TaxID=70779 RepID=UPI00077A2883|nr:PREDICTED: thymidine kinase, cytosolic-like [Acropora digitifera]